MLAGRKILVTGGAGFIGSHLTEHLVQAGARVTALCRRSAASAYNLAHVRGDIDVIEFDLVRDDVAHLLREGQYEIIFHLAGSARLKAAIDNPGDDLDQNTTATLKLLEGVRRASPSTTVLYTSSAVVYPGGGGEPIREDDPTGPTTPYAISKLAAEQYVTAYARLFGLRSAVLRLFWVYGPRLRKQIVFDLMTRLRAEPEHLVLQSDGTEALDFIYVADVVEALMVVATKAALNGEVYNVASGRPLTTVEMAKTIARAMGASPTISFSGRPSIGTTKRWIADTSKLASLGFTPCVSLEEGIMRTTKWFNTEAQP